MKKLHFILEDRYGIDRIWNPLTAEFRVDVSSSMRDALDVLRHTRSEFVFVDIGILEMAARESSYNAVFQTIGLISPNAGIIIMAPQNRLKEVVRIVTQGADSYLTHPLVFDEVQLVVTSILEQTRAASELDYLRGQVWQEDAFNMLQTKSPAMETVFEKIRAVAGTKSTVLLMGETGTGKGFTARMLHRLSARKDERFIEVHCGAIPDTLIESELFGHEKGAFTGAVKRKLGKFEIARNGTIFLDEIGTITPAAQIKLLKVLQDGVFHRVGAEDDIYADARIIAATNIDLKKMCEANLFRKDLYYRLNVFPIEIPLLKHRKEDIPGLVELFLVKLNTFHLKGILDVHPHVLEAFLSYSWPGNIRELENVMERAYILERSSVLRPENFPGELFDAPAESLPGVINTDLPLSQIRKQEADRVERAYLHLVLKQYRGRIKPAALTAGITTRQMHKLMTKHGLKKEDYKLNARGAAVAVRPFVNG